MIVLNRIQLGAILVLGLVLGLGIGFGIAYREALFGGASPLPMAADPSVDHGEHQIAVLKEGESGEREISYWYDPMHPAYRSDKPGTAPDCGMNLVPQYKDEIDAMADMVPGTVRINTEKQQIIGVRTAEVRRENLARTIRTIGQVEIDETRVSRVHTKVEGWVEEVYGDFVGKLVRKGQPLFTLYSPDLVSTQEEYLLARRGNASLKDSPYGNVSGGAEALLRASRERLRLWDINDEQIARLEESGEVQRTLTIVSPVTGYVMTRDIYPQTFVKPDKALYEIANLSRVWVKAELYEFEAPYARPGQSAAMTLDYFPGRKWSGRVAYIYPTVESMTRTVQVRLEFNNPKFELKPGMFADVEMRMSYGTHTVIPTEAVLDSGTRQVVFVDRGEGLFEPRNVTVGPAFDGMSAILSGLKPGETVVTSGNFLIDSESRLAATSSQPMQH